MGYAKHLFPYITVRLHHSSARLPTAAKAVWPTVSNAITPIPAIYARVDSTLLPISAQKPVVMGRDLCFPATTET